MCLLAVVSGTLLSLWLRAQVPMNVLGFGIGYYDDGLFARGAIALAHGDWLGPFDVVTLSKGPSYPLFIALTHRLGIALPVGEQLTYLMGAGLLAGCFLRVTRRPVAATAVYLVLAFDPANFAAANDRILRDSWYSGLSLLLFGLLFLTVHSAVTNVRPIWVFAIAVLTGVAGAAFWLCREEGAWLVPSAAVIVIGLPLVAVLHRYRVRGRPRPAGHTLLRRGVPVALSVAVLAGTCLVSIAAVAAKNDRAYGVRVTSDFAAGTFPAAYAAWSRIRGVPPETIALRPFVPINTEQRAAAAAVSPAARELQPVLTDPAFLANATGPGCATLDICDDYAGGWAPWAIRDAARLAGHATTAADLQAYFGSVADQINAACADGRLTCSPAVPSALQPFLRASVGDTLRSAMYWLAQLPVNEDYYSWSFDVQQPFLLSAGDRAAYQEGITGVPVTDAAAAAEVSGFAGLSWLYTSLSYLGIAAFLVMLLMSVAGAILGFRWRRDGPGHSALRILLLGLLVGIAARLVIFAVIATTQYDIAAKYHNPTRTFLLAVAAIGAAQFVFLIHRHRGHPATGPNTDRLVAESTRTDVALPG